MVKGGDTRSRDLVFVDSTEVDVASNKSRGISGPGWWLYETYTTAAGDTRHKAECLVFVHATAAAGDDADDTIVADVLETITIGTQPADQTTLVLQPSLLLQPWISLALSLISGRRKHLQHPLYKCSGATSASLALTGQTAAEDGDKYRVKINTSKGAEEVVSDAATLTFGS